MKLVYIVEDGSGNKKIGITRDIKRRMAELKTAVPTGIVSVMISDFLENARSIEKQLHNANKVYRLNGEWFSDVVDFGDIEFSKIETRTKIRYEETPSLPEVAYIKQYVEAIGCLCDLTRGEIRVLVQLVARVGYDGKVLLPLGVKRTISEELECSLSAVSNALTALTNSGIITRIDGGVYGLNPNYFARGKWRDIYEQRKSLRITIAYTDDGGEGKREIVTEQIDADIIQMPAQNPAK